MTRIQSERSWIAPISTVALVALAAWIVVTATIPAMRARAAADRKFSALVDKRGKTERETARLRAEVKALQTDYQYNRRMERWLFRGGPEPGD
jgi:hypothetical protein